jgi:hypothetical protein
MRTFAVQDSGASRMLPDSLRRVTVSSPTALLFAMALFLSACETSSEAAKAPTTGVSSIDDKRIVPGVRAGNISLGMSAADVLRILGEPSRTTQYKDGAQYNFSDDFEVFINSRSRRVSRISVEDPAYQTPEGIRVGSSDLSRQALLGRPGWKKDPSSTMEIYCYPSGLGVYVENGKVIRMSVYSPGCE